MWNIRLTSILIIVLFFHNISAEQNLGKRDSNDDSVDIMIKFVWDYGDGKNGVHHWPGICSAGEKQSPVDIITEDTLIQEGVSPFSFNGYDSVPLNLELKSKWHSLYFKKLVSQTDRAPYLTGGGLPGDDEFEFLSGHFHWASEGDGSEHHVDGDKAPLELHLVHWNKAKGNTPDEAIATNEWNALAVLAIKYDVGKHNKYLESLFNAMDRVHEEGTKTYLDKKLPLKSFLPRGTGRFVRYNGSLTTPPCNEVVIWNVFKDREYISQEQMDKLRAARSGEDRRRHLENNYRPAQSLNGRTILDIDTRDYGNKYQDKMSFHPGNAKAIVSEYKIAFVISILCISFVRFYI